MLFVWLASANYGLGAQLDEAIIELPHGPVEAELVSHSQALEMGILGVGAVAQAESSKANMRQRSLEQTGAPQGLPEGLSIEGQVALPRGGNGQQDDGMAAEVGLGAPC
jgi:hypothetical protein